MYLCVRLDIILLWHVNEPANSDLDLSSQILPKQISNVNNQKQQDVTLIQSKENQIVPSVSSDDVDASYKSLTEPSKITVIEEPKQPEQQSKPDRRRSSKETKKASVTITDHLDKQGESTGISSSEDESKHENSAEQDDVLKHEVIVENKSEQEVLSSSLLPSNQQSTTMSVEPETPVFSAVEDEEKWDKIIDNVQWSAHTPSVSTNFKRTSSERQSLNGPTFQNEQVDDIASGMKNAIQRLNSVQLDKYAYINENISELQTNIELVKALRDDIQQEKSLINSLLTRSNHGYSTSNDQDSDDVELLANDLKEKWENVRTTSVNLVERLDDYCLKMNQFIDEHDRLNDWLTNAERELTDVQTNSNLENINEILEKLKKTLETGVGAQVDIRFLQENLQLLHSTMKDFDQFSRQLSINSNENDNNNGENLLITKEERVNGSRLLFSTQQQKLEQLAFNYTDYLKRCKHLYEQTLRQQTYLNNFNGVNYDLSLLLNDFEQKFNVDQQHATEQ
ncbi:unnamed protein product, partial [Didymodactylos carnosus]